MTYDTRLLADAIQARLASQTSKTIGKGSRPDGADTPYAVVRSTTGPQPEGSLTDAGQIFRPTFLVFYVGDDSDEAQWMQTEARTALLGWTPTLVGFDLGPVELDLENVIDGPDFDGPVHEIADRFSVYLS